MHEVAGRRLAVYCATSTPLMKYFVKYYAIPLSILEMCSVGAALRIIVLTYSCILCYILLIYIIKYIFSYSSFCEVKFFLVVMYC